MLIVSLKENLSLEKRIAITPEIAKKYINLGFKVSIQENYGLHLGFTDSEFKVVGVNISKEKKELIINADIIIQLGLLEDEKLSLIIEGQSIIGIFNPYNNISYHRNT